MNTEVTQRTLELRIIFSEYIFIQWYIDGNLKKENKYNYQLSINERIRNNLENLSTEQLVIPDVGAFNIIVIYETDYYLNQTKHNNMINLDNFDFIKRKSFNIKIDFNKQKCNKVFELYSKNGDIINNLEISNYKLDSKYLPISSNSSIERFTISNFNISSSLVTTNIGDFLQEVSSTKIKDLSFIGCTFKNNIILTRNNLDNFTLSECTFEGKVTLLSNKFKDLKFSHSIFKEVVDFSSTSFGGIIKIADSTFKEGINLYNTSFFENEEKYPLEGFKKYFKTIEKDLVNADVLSNFRASINILKNSLDNAHNYIDGNKFYALEILAHHNYLREYLKDELKNKVKEKDRTACRKLLNYIYNPSITIDFLLIKLNSLISSNYQNTAKALLFYIIIIPFLAISVEIIKWEYFSWSWSDFFFLWQEITFPFNYAIKPKEDISIWFNIFRAFETYVLWQIIRSSMRNFKR